MDFWVVIGIFIALVVAYSFGVTVGRTYEINKRIKYDYDENMQQQYDEATQQGYTRSKMTIPQYMSLDQTNLALHRIEGLAKGLAENVTEMKRVVGNYGVEKTRPDERTETN